MLLVDTKTFSTKVQQCTFLDDNLVIDLQCLRERLHLDPLTPVETNAIKQRTEQVSQEIVSLKQNLHDIRERCQEMKDAFTLDMTQVFDDCELMKQSNAKVVEEVKALDNDLTEVYLKADGVESWGRRWTLLLNGIPEKKGESTNAIALDVSHSMGLNV